MEKLIFRIIGILIKLRNRILKPFTIGVRALILNDKEEILLVQHSYSKQWYLPGGGVDKKEHLIDGLRRELQEELGLTIKSSPKLLGTYSNFFEYKSDFISIFIVKDYNLKFKENLEIAKLAFFDCDDLPDRISIGTKKRIEEFKGLRKIDYKW